MYTRRLFVATLALAGLLAGCAEVAYDPPVYLPEGRADLAVPLRRVGPTLFARVSLDGRDAGWWLVDTGSSANVADLATAQRLGLRMQGDSLAESAAGYTRVQHAAVGELRMGEMTLGPHRLWVADLGTLTGALREPIGGVLGSQAFARLPVTIDYAAATLTFHRRDGFAPPAAELLEIRRVYNTPRIRAVVNGTYAGWFLVDTGSTAGVNLQPRFYADKPELVPPKELQVTEVYAVAGSVAQSIRSRLVSFDFGPWRLRNVPATLGLTEATESEDIRVGHVGGLILSRFRLTLDLQEGRLWMVPNPSRWPRMDAVVRAGRTIDPAGSPR